MSPHFEPPQEHAVAVKKEKERIQPLIPSVKDTTRSSTVAFAFALSACPHKLVVFEGLDLQLSYS